MAVGTFTSISIYAIAKAAAISLGITAGAMTASELIQAIEKKTGRKFNPEEWKGKVSEYSQIKTAENATSRLDTGERDRLNDLANINAENKDLTGMFADIKARQATSRLDTGERDFLNELANGNAEKVFELTQRYINAENATSRLDTGERDFLNELANGNAEKVFELTQRYINAENATSRLDTGERDFLNELANGNAEAAALQAEQKYINAENATSRLDTGERDRLNELANENAIAGALQAEQKYINAENATSRLDTGERDRLNELANENAIEKDVTTTDTPKTENKKDDEEEKDKMEIPTIENEDEEKLIEDITPSWNMEDIVKYFEDLQQKSWEREDAIRKETQEREDNAWQRSIADMKKAGINPNLVNATPAESGGGITNATQMDTSVISKQLENASNQLIAALNRELTGNENAKKNILNLITEIISGVFMFKTFKK